MASLARSIRRAIARRTGEKPSQRDFGQFVEGSIEGRPTGAKCFDYENRISADRVVVVHFRHPTKRRTAARVCNATYVRKAA